MEADPLPVHVHSEKIRPGSACNRFFQFSPDRNWLSKKAAYLYAELVNHLPISIYKVRGASLHKTTQNWCLHTFYFGLIIILIIIWKFKVIFQWPPSPDSVNVATIHWTVDRTGTSGPNNSVHLLVAIDNLSFIEKFWLIDLLWIRLCFIRTYIPFYKKHRQFCIYFGSTSVQLAPSKARNRNH